MALTIGNCEAPHSLVNGEFTGIATTNASNVWAYDSLLRMWLSKRDPLTPAAVTTLATPHGNGTWDY